MAQMIVRNIEDGVMESLKRLAKARGVSAEQQVRELIEREVEEERRWQRFQEASDRALAFWRERGIRFDDSTPLIREDRER